MSLFASRTWRFASVLSVVSLVISMIMVYVVSVNNEQSAKAECKDRLRSLSFAVDNYRSLRGHFPPGVIPDKNLPPEKRWSWLTLAKDYQDANAPSVQDAKLPWDDDANRTLNYYNKFTGKVDRIEDDAMEGFLCPQAHLRIDSRGYGLTTYVGVAGLGNDAAWLPPENSRAGIFGYRDGTRLNQVKDGLESTSMIVETASQNGPWRAAGVSTIRGIDSSRQPYIGKGRQFGGLHNNGAFVAFADGSVRFLSDNINPKVFEAMSTIAGGEPIASSSDIKP